MIELHPSQFTTAEALFRDTRYGVLAYGTLEGGHPGRVYVDQLEKPMVGLVCTRVGYYFLAGRPQPSFALRTLILDTLAPQQKATIGDPQILLFYPNPDWKEPLFNLFGDRQPIAIQKKRMVLRPGAEQAAKGWQESVPDRLEMLPITPALLQKHPELAGEVDLFWGSAEAFSQKSLGFCLLDGDTIACTCHGVFAGKGEVEISIATAEPYRCQGLGFLTASAFIDDCHQHGLAPVWGCWPNNEPSVALARRLGFVDDVDQEICFWEEA